MTHLSEGISKITKYDRIYYQIQCNCLSADHSCGIEFEHDEPDNFLFFYIKTYTKPISRFKLIWKLLTTGYIEYEGDLMMNKETTKNLIEVIKEEIEK